MTNKMNKILEKLRSCEKEFEKLLPQRKEEIFKVLESSGGITIENELLAGLATYINLEEGKNCEFLDKLRNLGSKKIPSKKRIGKANHSSSVKDALSGDSKKEKKDNG